MKLQHGFRTNIVVGAAEIVEHSAAEDDGMAVSIFVGNPHNRRPRGVKCGKRAPNRIGPHQWNVHRHHQHRDDARAIDDVESRYQ